MSNTNKKIILIVLLLLFACSSKEISFSSFKKENRNDIRIYYNPDYPTRKWLNKSILLDSQYIPIPDDKELAFDVTGYNERIEAARIDILNELDKLNTYSIKDTANVSNSSNCLLLINTKDDTYLRLYEDGSAVYIDGELKKEIIFIDDDYKDSYLNIYEKLNTIGKEYLDYITSQ